MKIMSINGSKTLGTGTTGGLALPAEVNGILFFNIGKTVKVSKCSGGECKCYEETSREMLKK